MFDLPADRPAIMGILNVTPDSFSDGGLWVGEAALARALHMRDEGADLIDVGGESTRPGSQPVELEEEARRVLPVVRELARLGVPVSIDTSKAEVARRALAEGARVVNDVTALADPDMLGVCLRAGATVCLMHMQGTPATMQANPAYEDVVAEVSEFLVQKLYETRQAGLEDVWIDPGFGFGKRLQDNIDLLNQLPRLCGLGAPVLVGVSRKGFVGKLSGAELLEDRLAGTLAAQVLAQVRGARILRVHDVAEALRASRFVASVQPRDL